MKTYSLTLFLLFMGVFSSAHEFPVAPVQIDMKVEQNQIEATVRSNSVIWLMEIIGIHPQSFPPTNWPVVWQDKAESYVNQHLRLFLDNQPLTGKLVSAAYVEEPFHSERTVVYVLRYTYRAGTVLSGEADFFVEQWEELQEEGHVTFGLEETYQSELRWSGPERLKLTIPIEKPRFEVLLKDVQMTGWNYAERAFQWGISLQFRSVPFLIFIVAALLLKVPARFKMWGWSLFGGLGFLTFVSPFPSSAFYQPFFLWGTVLIMSLIAVFQAPGPAWVTGLVMSGIVWGQVGAVAALSFSAPQAHQWGVRFSLFGSFLVMAFLVFGLYQLITFLAMHVLRKKSEFVADRLFSYHTRSVGFVLFIISLFQMFKTAFSTGAT